VFKALLLSTLILNTGAVLTAVGQSDKPRPSGDNPMWPASLKWDCKTAAITLTYDFGSGLAVAFQ